MSKLVTRLRRMCIPAVLMLVSASVAIANTNSHWTTGQGGTDSSSTHATYNPAHIWAAVKATHSGTITSGGRFHDGCLTTNPCHGAFSGSDYALDIGGGGGTAAKLYLAVGGVGSGGNPAADNNRDMSLYARVAAQGNFRNDAVGRPACNWQKFDILSTYYDSAGTRYPDKVIGELWLAHVYNFTYPVGTVINTNAVTTNPAGTGKWWYIDGITVATIYSGADVGSDCSTGAHVHMEFLSNHNWGAEYEWHNDEGPDGYNGLTSGGISEHRHGTAPGVNNPYGILGPEYTTQGSTVMGYIGGETTMFWMRDNPYYSSH